MTQHRGGLAFNEHNARRYTQLTSTSPLPRSSLSQRLLRRSTRSQTITGHSSEETSKLGPVLGDPTFAPQPLSDTETSWIASITSAVDSSAVSSHSAFHKATDTYSQKPRQDLSTSRRHVQAFPSSRLLKSRVTQTAHHKAKAAIINMSAGHYASQSPPTRIMTSHAAEGSQYPRHISGGQGNGYTSPRTQLPSMHRLASDPSRVEDKDVLAAKRRRIDDGMRLHQPASRVEGGDDDGQHRHAYDDRYSNVARSVAPRGSGASSAAWHPSSSSHAQALQDSHGHFASSSAAGPDEGRYDALRRSFGGDESTDTNVPIARRRGDAAQAKASRLHIDTGHSTESQDSLLGPQLQERDRLGPTALPHGATRSAPPHKMTFAERESLPPSSTFDMRDERQLPPFANRAPTYSYQRSPSSLQFRRGEAPESTDPGQGWESISAHSRRDFGPPGPANSGHPTGSVLYRGAPGGLTTPLTAARASAFVPQTATLPSPAYHSTQLGRQVSGGSSQGGVASGAAGNSFSGNGATHVGPRTAGLSGPAQPLTARLPEHMRSPPSSKTQFLSLFSNFYDSLNDSRTLKVTLEDQVRRSNTLLQTLQRSARVLELTVDRRLQEERSYWEARVDALESRCRRLEAKTDVGSPTPSTQTHSRNGSVHSSTAAAVRKDAEEDNAAPALGASDEPMRAQDAIAQGVSSSASPSAKAEDAHTNGDAHSRSEQARGD